MRERIRSFTTRFVDPSRTARHKRVADISAMRNLRVNETAGSAAFQL